MKNDFSSPPKCHSQVNAWKRLRQGRLRAVASLLVLTSAIPVGADLIRLNNGGELRGTVVRKSAATLQSQVTIVTLTGASIVVGRQDIEFVTPRSIELEIYEDRIRDLPDTVEAHWELAEWCRDQKLTRQRTEQLEAVVRIDPDHAEARHALRHTFHNGEWLTQEELMASRGYVRHKHRWVTQQELDLIEKTSVEREAEQQWFGKVRLWLGWLAGRNVDRQQEGLANLTELHDPDAIAALQQFLGRHDNASVRLLFVRILGDMDGLKPLRPLVERSLDDPEANVRSAAVAGLKPEHHEPASELYVAALQSDRNPVVRRAALALRAIGTEDVIDPLIDALVTQHRYKVSVQIREPSYAVGTNGSIGYANGSSLPPAVEGALRTGQLPYGAVVVPPEGPVRTKTVTVKRDEQNVEVRETLKQLTGQDFGYNERNWHLWWAAKQSVAAP